MFTNHRAHLSPRTPARKPESTAEVNRRARPKNAEIFEWAVRGSNPRSAERRQPLMAIKCHVGYHECTDVRWRPGVRWTRYEASRPRLRDRSADFGPVEANRTRALILIQNGESAYRNPPDCQALPTPASSFASTCSMLKLAGFCRGGNSANDCSAWATYATAGMTAQEWSSIQSQ